MLVVANRLPVAEGREAAFRDQFEKQSHLATEQPGCVRVELLEPVDADRHVIKAYWESQEAFEAWRSSDEFERAHDDIPMDLFTGPNELEVYELTVGLDGTD